MRPQPMARPRGDLLRCDWLTFSCPVGLDRPCLPEEERRTTPVARGEEGLARDCPRAVNPSAQASPRLRQRDEDGKHPPRLFAMGARHETQHPTEISATSEHSNPTAAETKPTHERAAVQGACRGKERTPRKRKPTRILFFHISQWLAHSHAHACACNILLGRASRRRKRNLHRYRGRLSSPPSCVEAGRSRLSPFPFPPPPPSALSPARLPVPEPPPLPSLLSRSPPPRLLLRSPLSESRSRRSDLRSPRSPLRWSLLSRSKEAYVLPPGRPDLESSGTWLMSWMNRHGSLEQICA